MTVYVRDARFFVVDEDSSDVSEALLPLEFDPALQKAMALMENGARIKVLHTAHASQIEITRFVSQGIPTELIE